MFKKFYSGSFCFLLILLCLVPLCGFAFSPRTEEATLSLLATVDDPLGDGNNGGVTFYIEGDDIGGNPFVSIDSDSPPNDTVIVTV
jgi:hypothetical protein